MLKNIMKRTREQILKEERDPCVICGTTNPQKFSARIMQSSMCMVCNRSPNETIRNARFVYEGNKANDLFNQAPDANWVHKELRRIGIYVPDYRGSSDH